MKRSLASGLKRIWESAIMTLHQVVPRAPPVGGGKAIIENPLLLKEFFLVWGVGLGLLQGPAGPPFPRLKTPLTP